MKQKCRQCLQYKIYEDFHKGTSVKRTTLCKKCFNKNRNGWVHKNREAVLQKRREYYTKNKSHIRELSKILYYKNREDKLKRSKEYHHKNRDEVLKRNNLRYSRDRHKIKLRIKQRNNIIKDYILNYLKDHPCKCGESDPVVLEFHHKKDKVRDISIMKLSFSKNNVIREIEKCEVLCANCHRIETSKNQNWYSNMNKIKCSRCKCAKVESAFGHTKHNKINKWCKLCHSEYNHDRYVRKKELWNNKKRERRYIARKFVLNYLKDHPCKCGESDPVVLEFHHKKDKKYNVWKMISQGMKCDRILKEIEKCDVLCANCHKKITCKNQNWYKTKGALKS